MARDFSLFKNLRGAAQSLPGEDDELTGYIQDMSGPHDTSPEAMDRRSNFDQIQANQEMKKASSWGDTDAADAIQRERDRVTPPKTINAKLPDGFLPVSDTQTLPDGFHPVLPNGFQKVAEENPMVGFPKASPVAEKGQFGKTLDLMDLGSSPKESDGFLSDLSNRAEGTGRQIIDMGTFIPRAMASWGKGIGELLQGQSREDAANAAEKVMSDTSLQGGYPTNPAIDTTMQETLGRATENLTSGSLFRENPLAKKIVSDTLPAVVGLKGGKEIADNVIQGSSRRVPEDLPQLNGPKPAGGSLDPVALIQEQQQFTNKANDQLVARYNNNPNAYGVDESGTRNPYNSEGGRLPPVEAGLDDQPQVNLAEPKASAAMDEMAKGTDSRFNFPATDGYSAAIMARTPDASPKTMSQALATVKNYSSTPYEIRLATQLSKIPNITSIPYFIEGGRGDPGNTTAHGVTYFNETGPTGIQLNVNPPRNDLSGISPQVVLHEALHGGTHNPLTIGNYAIALAGQGRKQEAELIKKKYPHEVQFAYDINNLRHKFEAALKEELGETGLGYWQAKFYRFKKGLTNGTVYSNMYPKQETISGNTGHEFISWAMTDPQVQYIMKHLYVAPDEFVHPKIPIISHKKSIYANGIWTSKELGKVYTKQSKYQQIANEQLGKTSVWDKFANSVSKLFGLDAETQIKKSDAKIKDYLEFIDTNQNGAQLLEDVVTPYLRARGNIKFNEYIMNDALNFFNSKGSINKKRGEPRAQTEMAAYSNLPPKAKEMVQKLVSPWKDYTEIFKDLGNDFYHKYKDLNIVTGNVYPVSMVKNIANNPIVTFGFSKTRSIVGDAHHFKKMLVDSIDTFKNAPVDQKKRLVLALNEINRPETQDQLKLDRQQNPQGYGNDPTAVTDLELTHYGAQQTDIPLYRKTLEPLFKALLHMDQWSMKTGFKRQLNSDVIGYYPRSFGYGKFSIKGFNSNGAMVFFRRAPTWKEVREFEEALRAKGYATQREVNKDFADFKEHIMALQEIDPKSTISKIGEATLRAAEEHRRTQEFERNARGVAGFIGQNINDPKEIKLLEQMAYHRIEQSIESYKAARLLSEVLRPIQADVLAGFWYPNSVKWVADIIRRELGSEMSKLGLIDDSIQWILDISHKLFLKRFTKLAYDLKPNEKTINPITHKELARYLSATSSAYALAGNIPNLVVNAFTVPLVSLLGGVPDTLMLNGDPIEAIVKATKAHTESLADLVLVITGQAKGDLDKFVKLSVNRGLIVANAFNDIPEMRAEIEKTKARRVWDKTLNVPREYFNDPVETATNITALLFYRRLIQEMYPKMKFDEAFDLAVDLAKRYTGDYAKYNKALMFDKLGDLGQTISNFSIWTGTRVAQGHELVKNVITKKQLAPLAALMLGSIVTAGLQGMPFAADYDKISQWYSHLSADKDTYIPPLDLVLKDANVPEWIRNGILLNSFGLDLSQRGKWSGFTDLGGVTLTMPAKAVDIYDFLYASMSGNGTGKSIIGDRYKPSGTSVKQDADFVQAMPAGAIGIARDQLMSRNLGGKKTILSSHGTAMYKQKKDDYWWNIMNFRTVNQADEQKNFYNSIYSQNKHQQEVQKLKSGAVEQLLKSLSAKEVGSKRTAMGAARANLIKLAKASPTAFDRFAFDILSGYEKETDTTNERELKKAAKSKDGIEVKRIIDEVKKFWANRPNP